MGRRSLCQCTHFALTLPVALAVVAAVGVVRLGRQFPGAAASPGLLTPFLLPVLALALEASAFVALSVSQLAALAVAPAPSWGWLRRLRETLPLALLLALVLGLAELIPRGTEHPGEFANRLVASARESCGAASRLVPIPLLGLSVRCGSPQRIEGPMPGVRGARVAMRELSFADDLRRVEIVGLDLTASRSLKLHLSVDSARVAGLAPWSRSPRLGPWARFGVLTGLGVALWLAVSAVFRVVQAEEPADRPSLAPLSRWRRLLPRLLFAGPGAVLAAGFIMLDQDRAEPAAYLGALAAAFVALVAITLAFRRLPRIFSSFRIF
ncbi:MAG TPA: hypothetical protein VHB79_06995 [Polyangiaceae bacterium]|nr:hypothetical protein [Polyangiaceae bacterium]